MPDAAPVIVWFRRDLRLRDNPAFAQAAGLGRPVIPLFILDETPGVRPPGAASRWWLEKSLRALGRDIEALGGRLVLRRGAAAGVLADVVVETGAAAVRWNRLYDAASVARDVTIRAKLTKLGVDCRSFNAALLNESWEIKTGAGGAYRVFSPYWRATRATAGDTAPTERPGTLRAPAGRIRSDAASDWSLHPAPGRLSGPALMTPFGRVNDGRVMDARDDRPESDMGPLTIALDDPELKKAPAAFRAAISIAGDNWDAGSLTFVLPSGRELRIEGRAPGPDGRLVIRDFRFVGRVLASADIGFGEGFVAGEWDTPDLSALLEAFTLNFDRLRGLVEGNPLMRTVNFLAQLLHRNSRRGARRNIHAHYDLGNAFYSRWLDPSMTYSSARYERPGQSLGDAQRHKYASLARDIGLEARHHVLEIGCGWGGFAEFAAREVGARVTGVTISPAQYEFARKRLFDQGLADRADIRLIDYRDVEGQFDRVASIEMFEAVGETYWPAYFRKVRDVLSPAVAPACRSSPSATNSSPSIARVRTFCANTSFQAGCSPAKGGCARKPIARALSGKPWSASARTTPTPWPSGAAGSRRPGRRSGPWGSMSGFAGCGGST